MIDPFNQTESAFCYVSRKPGDPLVSKFVVLVVICSAASFTAAGGYTLLPQPLSLSIRPDTDQNCNIKGNISSSTGERIYHVPGQKYYDAARVNYARGERWFCSEAEARSAGWRKSKV